MSGQAIRYDRHGRPEREPSPATRRAMAILRAAAARPAGESRKSMKARQDAGELNPRERLLLAVFGEIKK